jgi:NAD(P)-dependent dehydrogenase (short-subunit alcohol dehydrogenase family)
VKIALDRGDSVVATSRQPENVTAQFPHAGERLFATPLNLGDTADIAAVVDRVVARFGAIDVLINNAGHGMLGALEEVSEEEIAKVFELNVFGLLRLTKAVLPIMRKQKGGVVVNLSSVGGLVGLPGWGIYNATKFAVEGLSEALAAEAGPLGIQVMIVEPGPFRTDFLGGSLAMAQKEMPEYQATAGQTRQYQQTNHGAQAGDPVRAAQAIVDAVVSGKPPLHLVLGKLAYQRTTAKLEALRKEMDAWREVGLGTDYPQ